jgi:cytochrome P450
MPYTSAALLESFRVSSLAFTGVPRCALEDLKIGSYTIPKDTTVMGFFYYCHHDPKNYADPDVFKPERFIDKSGNFVYDEKIIPFGTGKRFCLGQSLAEKEFFIFFTALIQQFEFRPAPGVELPSYHDIHPFALLRVVPPYQVVIKKRLS